MGSNNRLNTLASSGAALLITAMLAAGCTATQPTPTPARATPAATVAVPQRQRQQPEQLEYLVTKNFSAAEFEWWVDSGYEYVAQTTLLGEYASAVKAAIKALTGSEPKLEFVSLAETSLVLELRGKPGPNEYYEIVDAQYDHISNVLKISYQFPALKFLTILLGDERLLAGNIMLQELHMLYHNLSDANAEIDTLEMILFENNFRFATSAVDNAKIVVLVKGADSSKEEANAYQVSSRIWAEESVPISDVASLLGAYAKKILGITEEVYDTETVANNLAEKLDGLMTCSLANQIITQAQAYFAVPIPPVSSQPATSSELQRQLAVLIPFGEDKHLEYLLESINQVARGYAALEKVRTPEMHAHIRMAELVGKSMAISQNEFEPYERLRKNIDGMVAELGVEEPTREELAQLWSARKNERKWLSQGMATMFRDYINSTVIMPFLDARLPPAFIGAINGLHVYNYSVIGTNGGGYRFTAQVTVQGVD